MIEQNNEIARISLCWIQTRIYRVAV